MSWIAIAEQSENRFNPEGIGRKQTKTGTSRKSQGTPTFLARGSLVIETRLSPSNRPQVLLAYRRSHPWRSSLSIQAMPNGGISLIATNNGRTFHTALRNDDTDSRTDVLRITYSWDIALKTGRLTIERPEIDKISTIELSAPQPLAIEDVRAMTLGEKSRDMDDDVVYFAVSTNIEPVGPMPSLTGNVPIATVDGYRRAETLKRGDLVQTISGDLVPILQVLHRTVPAKGSFRPVRLRAPYFGLARDIVVGPQQRLVVGGSEVEYMFGKESVLVPARHLINGTSALFSCGAATITYCQLLLPNHEAILAAGCTLESLYIGRIRRRPKQLSTTLLAGVSRNFLPEHSLSAYPVLKPFEAITLANQRVA